MPITKMMITANGRLIDLTCADDRVNQHYMDPRNFVDAILHQTNVERIYERWFRHKQDLTVLDIGGNIGLFALHVEDTAKTVISVEPTPDHYDILSKLTHPYPTITPVQAALHAATEKCRFSCAPIIRRCTLS